MDSPSVYSSHSTDFSEPCQWEMGKRYSLSLFPVLAPESFTKHITCISFVYYSDKRYLAKKVLEILPSLYSGDPDK